MSDLRIQLLTVTVKFTALFNQTAKLWPDRIEIADGELRDDDGGYFPTLSKSWNEAETNGNSIGPWHGLMVWAQFCGLHQAACLALRDGASHVDFDVIDRQFVKQKLLDSLHSEDGGYGSMRNEFVDDADPES